MNSVINSDSRMWQRTVMLLLFCLLVVLVLVAWRGPMREKDIKTYKISLPVILNPDVADSSRWRASEMRSLDAGPDAGHSLFELEVDFLEVSDREVQGTSTPAETVGHSVDIAEVLTARYRVTPKDAVLLAKASATNSAPPRPSLEGLGRKARLAVSAEPDSAGILMVEGRSYRYPREYPHAVSREPITGLSGLSPVGEKEFLTIEHRETGTGQQEQYITLVQLPSTESPSADGAVAADLSVHPLVNLTKLGFPTRAGSLALFSDGQTIAVMSGDAFDKNSAGEMELWLIRLPGSLRTSMTLAYVGIIATLLLAVVLVVLSFRTR